MNEITGPYIVYENGLKFIINLKYEIIIENQNHTNENAIKFLINKEDESLEKDISLSTENEDQLKLKKTFKGQESKNDFTSKSSTMNFFNCPIEKCKHQFKYEFELKEHLKNYKRHFICDICNKSVSRRYSLLLHKRTHTGERPYKCKYEGCTKSFKIFGDLNRHNRIHTGHRPYKCSFNNECKSSFTTKTNLNIHMRTHTHERPYKCEYENCQNSYTQLNSYVAHKKCHEIVE